jgi:hypothetical protein
MRARNIKPGFFKNDHLLECDPLARILFEGLWCLADRQGKLEDRPTKIKIEILPCDNCDANVLLEQLALKMDDLGKPALINRYVVNNKRYIQIVNFSKHQNPHMNEAESIIPEPEEYSASTMQTLEEHQHNPADSLIPDSLIPDPLTTVTTVTDSCPQKEASGDESSNILKCPHQDIISVYHKTLPELPRVKHWPENLQAIMRTRWKEDQARQNLEWWEKFLLYVHESDFLMGRAQGGFMADLEWLVRPKNFTKIANGRYHHGGNGTRSKAQPGISAWLAERGQYAEA